MMKREMKKLMREIAAAPVGDKSWLEQKLRAVRKNRRKRLRKVRKMAEWMRMREIEELGKRGDKKMMWNRLKGEGGRKMGGDRKRMKGDEGEWVEGEELRKRWREVFESVGQRLEQCGGYDEQWKEKVDGDIIEGDRYREAGEMDDDITEEEVRVVVQRLRNGKAAGVDGVIGELLKEGGNWMITSLWVLCKRMYTDAEVPEEWTRAIKVPVLKKGTGEKFQQYRGVTLLSVVSKVYGMVLEKRLRRWCEERGVLVDEQMGFREGRMWDQRCPICVG